MTLPQAYNVVVALETLVYLTSDKENVMKHPRPYKICQHDSRINVPIFKDDLAMIVS